MAGFGVAACAVAIFAIGGAPRWAQASVCMLLLGAVSFAVPSKRVFARPPALIALLAFALAVTLAQLVPLPHAVLELVTPVGSGLRDDGARLLGFEPSSAISMDAPGGLRAVAYFLALIAVAFVCLRLSVSENGRYRIVATIGLLLGAAALVVGIHQLFGLKKLYGVYALQHANPRVLGPLLNENHLGGLMAVGTIVSLGLVAYRRQTSWKRVGWLFCAMACGIAAVETSSRGATLGMLVGAAVLGALLLGQRFAGETTRGNRGTFVTRSLPIGIVAACTVILVIYAGAGRVEQQFASTSIEDTTHPRSKYAAWRDARYLVEEAPLLGVGRGGFETSFTRVHPASGMITFSHLENEYLQTVVDWGIVGTIGLALLGLWVLSLGVRRWRNGPLAAVAIASMAIIATQSMVDFGVEMMGLAVPLVALLATVSYGALEAATPRRVITARSLRTVLCLSLLTAAVLVVSDRSRTVDEDHQLLDKAMAIEDVKPALERHPLDYYGYLVAARVASKQNDRRSIELLNHALILHPTHPGLHHLAANLLLASGHSDQAAIELAAALRTTPRPAELVREIAERLSPDQAVSAIPLDYPDALELVQNLKSIKRVDLATDWLEKLIKANPRNSGACDLLYKLALDAHDLDAAEIAGRRCVEIIPDRQTRLALAHIVMNKNGFSEAMRLLSDVETWDGKIEEKREGWLLLCDSHIAAAHLGDGERCLHRLEASGLLNSESAGAVTTRLEAIRVRLRDQSLAGSAAGNDTQP